MLQSTILLTCHLPWREPIEGTMSDAAITNLEKPALLTWQVSSKLGDAIRTAEQNASTLIDDLDSVLLHYPEYGSNLMKQAKVSPDGWLQMVYQLAYFKHYGTHCPTYESASTRKFIAGRTETVRTCSTETVAFTKAWQDKDVKVTLERSKTRESAVKVLLFFCRCLINWICSTRPLLAI